MIFPFDGPNLILNGRIEKKWKGGLPPFLYLGFENAHFEKEWVGVDPQICGVQSRFLSLHV